MSNMTASKPCAKYREMAERTIREREEEIVRLRGELSKARDYLRAKNEVIEGLWADLESARVALRGK